MKLTKEDLKDMEDIEMIYKNKVEKFGNGAMIKASKKYLGQDCVILIQKKKKN